jgi:AhpC/TSA family
MVMTSMASLVVSALLMGGLLVPGHAKAVTVNQPAPDFTLPSTTGDTIRLSQFRGQKMVLLEFYGINFGTT